jgi:hypothetical protein
MPEPIFMKLWHLSPTERPSLINPSHQPACLYVYPRIVVRQLFGKHVLVATNTCNSSRIAGRVIFYAIRVMSNERRWFRLCIPSFSVRTAEVVWSEDSHSPQTIKYGHDSRATEHQESLCWREPAAYYRT